MSGKLPEEFILASGCWLLSALWNEDGQSEK